MRGESQREPAWTRAESEAMSAALEAARQGPRGANPLVGAAILIDDRLIAVGHHRGAGTPHAEVDAIETARRAGADLSRAELLVTLEPCGHTGRTPPCAQAVIDAGIPRVIHAIDDPNPTAAGGAAALRAAGVEVRSGLLAEEAAVLNARWLECARAHRPFVTAKTAMTLDGRIAAADILAELGLRRIRLLTNNPLKVEAMRRAGIDVVGAEPLEIPARPQNLAYLRTKRDRMNHVLTHLS